MGLRIIGGQRQRLVFRLLARFVGRLGEHARDGIGPRGHGLGNDFAGIRDRRAETHCNLPDVAGDLRRQRSFAGRTLVVDELRTDVDRGCFEALDLAFLEQRGHGLRAFGHVFAHRGLVGPGGFEAELDRGHCVGRAHFAATLHGEERGQLRLVGHRRELCLGGCGQKGREQDRGGFCVHGVADAGLPRRLRPRRRARARMSTATSSFS